LERQLQSNTIHTNCILQSNTQFTAQFQTWPS